ncbi:hypothetical protein HKD37_19G052804 [Glycine soja]
MDARRKVGKERVPERVGIDFGSPLWLALRLLGRSSSFSFCLSSYLSQTGLRFRDCNHIVEFVFVEFVSAIYRLSSKKSRKGKSPGKGGNRFWKSIVVGFKTPREAIEDPQSIPRDSTAASSQNIE